MNKIKRLQIGEGLDFYTLSHDKMHSALRKILLDSKYVENVKRVSQLVHDQREKPLDRAIWWIEWVLRHPNVNHTRSPVISLGYIVGNSIDIIGFSAIVFILQVFITYKLIIFGYKMNVRQRFFCKLRQFNSIVIHKKIQ